MEISKYVVDGNVAVLCGTTLDPKYCFDSVLIEIVLQGTVLESKLLLQKRIAEFENEYCADFSDWHIMWVTEGKEFRFVGVGKNQTVVLQEDEEYEYMIA
jgi:hypothetical protein